MAAIGNRVERLKLPSSKTSVRVVRSVSLVEFTRHGAPVVTTFLELTPD